MNRLRNVTKMTNDCHPNTESQAHRRRERRKAYGACPIGSLSIRTIFNDICTSPA